MYVDDLLNAGDSLFQAHTESTLKLFDSKPRVYDNFDFFGAQVHSLHDGSRTLSQCYFASTMKPA